MVRERWGTERESDGGSSVTAGEGLVVWSGGGLLWYLSGMVSARLIEGGGG